MQAELTREFMSIKNMPNTQFIVRFGLPASVYFF